MNISTTGTKKRPAPSSLEAAGSKTAVLDGSNRNHAPKVFANAPSPLAPGLTAPSARAASAPASSTVNQEHNLQKVFQRAAWEMNRRLALRPLTHGYNPSEYRSVTNSIHAVAQILQRIATSTPPGILFSNKQAIVYLAVARKAYDALTLARTSTPRTEGALQRALLEVIARCSWTLPLSRLLDVAEVICQLCRGDVTTIAAVARLLFAQAQARTKKPQFFGDGSDVHWLLVYVDRLARRYADRVAGISISDEVQSELRCKVLEFALQHLGRLTIVNTADYVAMQSAERRFEGEIDRSALVMPLINTAKSLLASLKTITLAEADLDSVHGVVIYLRLTLSEIIEQLDYSETAANTCGDELKHFMHECCEEFSAFEAKHKERHGVVVELMRTQLKNVVEALSETPIFSWPADLRF